MGKSKQQRVQETPDEILFLFGAGPMGLPGNIENTEMKDGEKAIAGRLEELGYTVEATSVAHFNEDKTKDKSLVIISSTVDSEKVGRALHLMEIPIIISNGNLFACMGLTRTGAGRNYGFAAHDEKVLIVDPKLEMAGGLKAGPVVLSEVATSGPLARTARDAVEKAKQSAEGGDGTLIWGIPEADAIKIAVLENDKTQAQAVVFGYELCAKMDGLRAPARRVGLFLDQRIAVSLTREGWTLFDAAVGWAIGDEEKQFPDVFKEEWQEIKLRRSRHSHVRRATDGCQPPNDLVGLALSGGGIRSATFCLGFLQGLHELKFLRIFDYLSTVSGGGYLGGWWSAWLSRPDLPGDVPRKDIFPDEERIELDRARNYLDPGQSEGAGNPTNTDKDSIHHLRLFANYLTPRKGLLSADSWRAIAIITRNLILTWLILLPLLVVFVLAGQLYFALQPNSFNEFALPFRSKIAEVNKQREEVENNLKLEREKKYSMNQAEAALREGKLSAEINQFSMVARDLEAKHKEALWKRAKMAALPILPLAGWIIGVTAIWMVLNMKGSKELGWVGGIAVFIILSSALYLYRRHSVIWFWDSLRSDNGTRIVVALWLIVAYCLWRYSRPSKDERNAPQISKESLIQVQLNRATRAHVRLLVTLLIVSAVLALAGFGHELVEYIFQPDNALVVQAGGWTAIASAIAGSIFTAVKGSPMGGGDPRASDKPSLLSRIIFAITPPLVLIVLALGAAWLARWAMYYITQQYIYLTPSLTFTCFVAVTLWLIFASAEMNLRRVIPRYVLPLVWGLVIVAGVVEHLLRNYLIGVHNRVVPLLITFLVSGFVLLRVSVFELPEAKGDRQRLFKFAILRGKLKDYPLTVGRLIGWSVVLAFVIGIFIVVGVWVFSQEGRASLTRELPHSRIWTGCAALTGLLLCMVLILFEIIKGKGRNRRSIVLIMTAYFVLTALLVISFFVDYKEYSSVLLIHVAVGLLATVFGWVAALGWMADPNALSLHTFYKSRLVRAYMGASNHQRDEKQEITDAVEGDDLLLKKLLNCQRGAPYHLINTTLNLVGGRDLTTAQRSSAAFVLSKLYCGSSRTWYRKTKKYMDGRLSLGAAVAASGAAVSPNMGSLRTSASLAMLMTLLNIRLGYWAPTPDKDNWRLSQTRLWPFYMLREFLSQTTDLSTYCYLTDGGHFENTGLYSLIERGCRYIVLVDSAADPVPCFADLGNAIRRCRIDFKTEITLDITSFIKKSKGDRFASHHYAVGEIKYDAGYLKKLGWTNTSPERLTGVIVYIKPALLKEDKDMTPDVRQYEIENEGFPQQTTTDQWFDEAQFESYRQLGYQSAKAAFGTLDLDENCAYREAFKKQQQGTTLRSKERILVDAKQASDQIRSGRFVPGDIKKVFNFFHAFKPQKPPEKS